MSHLFTLFLVTSLANILTPGLGVVMIVTFAAAWGWRRTLWGCAGTAVGIAILFAVAMSGVGVVLATSPLLFAAVKLAGAGFLVWLGFKTLRRKAPAVIDPDKAREAREPAETRFSLFWKCVVLQLTNPQPVVFAVSVLPQFVDAKLPYVPQAVLLTSTYALLAFVCMVGYALLAGRARDFLLRGRGPLLMYRASGTVFLLIALIVAGTTIAGLTG